MARQSNFFCTCKWTPVSGLLLIQEPDKTCSDQRPGRGPNPRTPGQTERQRSQINGQGPSSKATPFYRVIPKYDGIPCGIDLVDGFEAPYWRHRPTQTIPILLNDWVGEMNAVVRSHFQGSGGVEQGGGCEGGRKQGRRWSHGCE